MPTAAKAAFDRNIQRASYFLDVHATVQAGAAGAPTLARRELPRGAVVFAIGALDAYLSDASAEVLIAQCEGGVMTGKTRIVMRDVSKVLPGLALELAVVPDAKERLDRLRLALTDHFQTNVSAHGPKAVADAVERMGGVPRIIWDGLVALGFSDPAKELDTWTDIRHRIVHRGEKPRVWREHARECIRLLEALAAEVDQVAEAAIVE